jgi:predicted GNAT superfamily acetyltransferase
VSVATTAGTTTDPAVIRAAAELAEESEAASGAEIRPLLLTAELRAASTLLADVWGVDPTTPQLGPEILIALAHSGNYVCGAFRDGRMVAASVGFFHTPAASALHSHITGVLPGSAASGVGYALKLHQRAWCLARDVATITWTYDPLVARNAYFNLRKLGGTASEYLTDHYGAMSDGVNRGQASDRMLLRWDLRGPVTGRHPSAMPDVAVLRRAADRPVVSLDVSSGIDSVRLEVPSDIEALRRHDADLAGEWREALRAVVTTLLSDGWRLVDFDRSGYYVAERTTP